MLWDSGQEFIYRIGAEDAYDLRVSSAQYFDDILYLLRFTALLIFTVFNCFICPV